MCARVSRAFLRTREDDSAQWRVAADVVRSLDIPSPQAQVRARPRELQRLAVDTPDVEGHGALSCASGHFTPELAQRIWPGAVLIMFRVVAPTAPLRSLWSPGLL
eukprot:3762645-Alexandrium_andersonii.AAC.1